MLEEIFKKFAATLEKILSRFREDINALRTGRPTPALVEDVPVECYGTKMLLKEIASITIQPPNILLIQPWDKANLQAIERAFLKSELGALPTIDGNIIRLVLPPLTEERRKDLVRLLHRMAEEARISFRQSRDEARKEIARLAADKKISEDEKFRAQERIQKEFDIFQEKIQKLVQEREKEIMTI